MLTGVELLADACGSARPRRARGMRDRWLRFVLEYPRPFDAASERQRMTALIGADRFQLIPLFEPTEASSTCFVALQIPGLERTLPVDALFGIGYDLIDRLQLVSAEPELGFDNALGTEPADVIDDEVSDAPGVESVGGFLKRLCFVGGDGPENTRWALDAVNSGPSTSGPPTGILIAQPDTGVTRHDELADAHIRLDLGINLVEGGGEPIDPMRRGADSPGHGTGTGSVIISGPAGTVTGIASDASLVPIRCIDDVKVFSAAPVAAAIAHARIADCHVITMSLGGVPSRAVHRAILDAIEAGMIVLAAAGNCVRTVVWPARYSEVIAVAATNIASTPWRGSCRGDAVDISAPGEQVWRATASRGQPLTESAPGQGTSFAVALTAGAAARWLARHTPGAVRAAALSQGVSVQELFRKALVATARRPAGWDSSDFGAGILDVAALLARPLTEPGGAGGPAVESAAPRSGHAGLRSIVAERIGGPEVAPAAEADEGFDWVRFGLEVAAISLDDLSHGSQGLDTEASGPPLSDQVIVALAASSDPLLARFGSGRRTVGDLPPELPPLTSATQLRRLRTAGPDEHRTLAEARSAMTDDVVTARIDRLRAIADASPEVETASVVSAAERVFERLRAGGDLDRDDLDGRVVVEALVQMEGRPVLALTDAPIDPNDPRLGDWQDVVALALPALERARASVGRIDGRGVHQGTGFVIGPGLVLTNRHVVENIAAPVPQALGPQRWVLPGEATFNLDPAAVDPARSFRIRSVVAAGRWPIGTQAALAKLDVAVVDVETVNAAGRALPAAIDRHTSGAEVHTGDTLFLLGYPARPRRLPRDADGKIRVDVAERLRVLFGQRYGVQYLSPGEVLQAPADVTGNPRRWAFTHDATSLGGNSGSCVLGSAAQMQAVGLHVAGDWLTANYAHSFIGLAASSDLPPALGSLIRSG